MDKVKAEINRMLDDDVISPVEEPTEWCSGIVVVPKADRSSVRICVDLTSLNKAVLREVHPLSSVDEDLACLSGSKIFTKLDARSGFWQMPLDQQSRFLTTFLTPFGRFCMNRLPFGISSAPEIFQRRMSEILRDIDGVICHMDDILIHASNQDTHDERVRTVLQRLQQAGLTLNEKCEFSKPVIKFLGHIIDGHGIRADPQKIEAIVEFPVPTNITELQRFLGMVNQLAKFSPELASQTEPLRQLLKRDSLWSWGHPREQSFQTVKKNLTSTPVLAHYCAGRETIIAADASNAGLGAVLLQIQPDGSRRPVSYISRSLTPAEKNYAIIEKEALAATWAFERFSEYILGSTYTIETDHKPLVPLLTTKELYKKPPRIQRFRLRLMRFSPNVIHVSGKQQITADALSRAPASALSEEDITLVNDADVMAKQTLDGLPASSRKLQDIITQQKCDPEIVEVRNFCQRGWPAFLPQNPLFRQYWVNQRHLTIVNDLLLFNNRIVIPTNMRLDMLNKLHESHLGVTKCRALAETSVWWPNISSQIEDMVRQCNVFAKLRPNVKKPLLPSSFPEHPWSRVAMDLFDLHGKTYLLLVDYHSRWPEIRLLDRLSSAAVIARLKSIFATHGIPDVLVSDNGPQFASAEFRKFTEEFCFTHTTSSPRYPQANGEAERAEGKYREQQRSGYNKRHSAKQASELQPGDYVFTKDLKRQGSVLTRHQNPRSYIICTDQGTIRRNRSHLVATPASSSSPALVSTQVREQSFPGHHVFTPRTPHSPRPSPTAVSEGNSETQPRVSRSGRPINPPKRLDL
ncbi:Pol polyprotein [Plakobranchus ocellatus]|uniref:Pol polyprotein n=1 Tax=Plakobranchus ocellatus TaxID=259542 RepID=A0AAV4CDR2_9GAST|nr:Pol polyprotein [Plakobranchus ocellatus]